MSTIYGEGYVADMPPPSDEPDEPGDWAKELGPMQQGDIELLEDAIEALLQPRNDLQREHALHGLQKRVEAARTMLAEGRTVPPDWKGYALLGDPARTGGYVMEHSAAPPDPELGAEFIIRPATAKDREGNRKVGESRLTDGGPIQPETMAIRIGFLNVAALDALEAQLRILREENFPADVPAGVNPSDGGKAG